jgi:hypothetical protein
MWSADFESKKINGENFIFRYNTEYKSSEKAADAIGLIVMMNPGSARPECKENASRLEKEEIKLKKELIRPDPTMRMIITLINTAYEHNKIPMPEDYILHIENLFNLKNQNAKAATTKVISNKLPPDLLYKSRQLTGKEKYHFVFFAWGNPIINPERQNELFKLFPDAIQVNKVLSKGEWNDVNYPVHVQRISLDFNSDRSVFKDAVKGKIM